MAKPVSFGSKPKKAKASRGDTSFNFGFNALSKKAKQSYNKSIGRRGTAAGGS